MPKYLITATAYRRAEGTEAYAPRTFTFEAVLDAPWNGKNAAPVGDMAFDQCHRTFGWWPKHNPQIDSVVEIYCPEYAELQDCLDRKPDESGAAYVEWAEELAVHADNLLCLLNIHSTPVTPVDWSDADGVLKHGNPETPQPEAAADDYDDLI